MKASAIKIKELKTYEQLDDARTEIESDYQNVIGGIQAWCSGRETHMTASAVNKLDAIEAKMERLFGDEE